MRWRAASRQYVSALDKAGKTGLVHANKVARQKARCARLAAARSCRPDPVVRTGCRHFRPLFVARAGGFFAGTAMSSQNKTAAAVGFPPPLLGSAPQRLPILEDAPGWLALEKPAGVGTRAHPWDPHVPDLDQALNLQLASA